MKISFKYYTYLLLMILGLSSTLTSCTDDLNVTPGDDDEFLSEAFYADPSSYKQVLAKLYGGMYLGGNDGDGDADIAGLRGDFSSYLRLIYVNQEVPTDEATIAWADGNLPSMSMQTWTPANEFIYGIFSRSYFEIGQCNEFLRQTTEEKLSSRGVDSNLKAEIQQFRAEARFLRAYSYFQLMDLFGNVPITTENDPVGFYYPQQKPRAEVFAFLESELKALDSELVDSKMNEYGRVDKAAAKFLLAKIYLNAQVYINVEKNAEAATLCDEIIASSGYTFANVPYRNLFTADNNTNGSQSEFIFPLVADGIAINAVGSGISFILHAAIGGSMDAATQGMNGGWGGIRTRKEFLSNFSNPTGSFDYYQTNEKNFATQTGTLVNDNNVQFDSNNLVQGDPGFDANKTYKFNYATGLITLQGNPVSLPSGSNQKVVLLGKQQVWSNDSRIMTYTPGQTLDITQFGVFTSGYALTKFSNLNANYTPSKSTEFPNTNFPVFRLTDAYLMYAEATLRGASTGNPAKALDYVNAIRTRAKASVITSSQLNLPFILAERGRELYWENHRRNDLIRFGLFTGGNYNWQWKGGIYNGTSTSDIYNLMPIPSRAIQANPTLQQNPGY